MAYSTLHEAQKDDEELKNLKDKENMKDLFGTKRFGKYKLWLQKSTKDNKWRIFVPKKIRVDLLEWYHEALLYPGQSRMEESVLKHFIWPCCRNDIMILVKSCKICQIYKNSNNGVKAGRSGELMPDLAKNRIHLLKSGQLAFI